MKIDSVNSFLIPTKSVNDSCRQVKILMTFIYEIKYQNMQK